MNTLLEWLLTNAVLATALAVLVALVSRWIRWPTLVRALWIVVLLRFVAPPMLPVAGSDWVASLWNEPEPATLRPVMDEPIQPAATPAVLTAADLIPVHQVPLAFTAVEPPAESPLESNTGGSPWTWMGLGLWIAGGLTLIWIAARRTSTLRRLLRHVADTDDGLRRQLTHAARRLGARTSLDLKVLRSRVSPFLWVERGRGTVAFPEPLREELGPRQVQLVMAHEVAHFVLRDHWVRRLELLCTALFWWCPTLWWVRSRLHQSQEAACDSLVLKRYSDDHRQDYARALLAVTEFIGPRPGRAIVGMAVVGPQGSLTRRVEMVLSKRNRHGLGVLGRTGVLGLSAMVLPWSMGEVDAQDQECEEVCVLEEVEASIDHDGDEEEIKVILRKLDDALGGKIKSKSESKDGMKRRVVYGLGDGGGEAEVIVLGDGEIDDERIGRLLHRFHGKDGNVDIRFSKDGNDVIGLADGDGKEIRRRVVRRFGHGDEDGESSQKMRWVIRKSDGDEVKERSFGFKKGEDGQWRTLDGAEIDIDLDDMDFADLGLALGGLDLGDLEIGELGIGLGELDLGELGVDLGGLDLDDVHGSAHGVVVLRSDDGEVKTMRLGNPGAKGRFGWVHSHDDDDHAHGSHGVRLRGLGHGTRVVDLSEEGLGSGVGIVLSEDGDVIAVNEFRDADAGETENLKKRMLRMRPHVDGNVHGVIVNADGEIHTFGEGDDLDGVAIDLTEIQEQLEELGLSEDGRILKMLPRVHRRTHNRVHGHGDDDNDADDDIDRRIERLERELQELKEERAAQRRSRRTTY